GRAGGGQAARLGPSAPQAGRPARGAHPRARGRAGRERAARAAGAGAAHGRGRGVGPAAGHERLDADRRRDARPRLPSGRGEGGPDPGPHRESPRAPGRGADAADRLHPVGRGRGGDRLRAPGGGRGRLLLAPEAEARPWGEQLALDDADYRVQIAYLLERSPFYRRRLGEAGVKSPEEAGGLAAIVGLPLTGKQELRATATAENPVGAHLAARPEEIVRVY